MLGKTMAKVFISHSSTDPWVAFQVEGHVKACGLDTFLDERDIASGDQFLQRIIDAERECDELLALRGNGLTPAKLLTSPQIGDPRNRRDA